MKFKDIIPEDVKSLPGKTSGVMEKLREFYEDQLPKPYWDEYSEREITDSPDPGSVHSVKDGAFSHDEENGTSFDVDISFSKVPHETILKDVVQKIKEFGGVGVDVDPARKAVGMTTSVIRFRDGQAFCLATITTAQSDPKFYPRHELHFRRRQRPH